VRGRVVDGQQEAIATNGMLHHQTEDHGGHVAGLASDAVEEVVIQPEVRTDPRGAPPVGGGASAVSQEDAHDDRVESVGRRACNGSAMRAIQTSHSGGSLQANTFVPLRCGCDG
jgi:hypothetical protein